MQTIDIKGLVLDANSGQLWTMLGMLNTNPVSIQQQLKNADGDDIELSIASDGGDVFAASEIYTMLKQYPGKVTGTIQGLAASAASVIAEACDHLVISPAGQMMIHKAKEENVTGNADDLIHEGNVLNGIDQTLASIYEAKTGKSQDEIIDLMKTETWLTAKKAVEQGFADEILEIKEKSQPQIVNAIGSVPSKDAVADILKLVKNAKQNKQEKKIPKTDSHGDLFARKLAILKGE